MRKIILSRQSGLFLCLLAVLLAAPALSVHSEVAEKPIWLVVTRPIFLEAIKPLAELRSKDGFETVISTRPVNESLAALKRRPAFLLLVGDDEPGKEKEGWYVGSRQRKLYRWRAAQRKEFASDTLWGDFDGDLIPDVPVGRIPVRTVKELKVVVSKIIAFEQKQPTLDDLRLLIWTGTPGINPVIDSLTTTLLLNVVKLNASEWLRPWIITADQMHSLCGWPPDQCSMFTKQLKGGGLMAVLMGHGSAKMFYVMNFKGRYIRYTATDAKEILATGEPSPAIVIITCSSGNFVGEENCLAESLLLMPAGPVAVIGATTESHPLPNYFSGLCLLRAQHGNDKRLGSLWLTAQQQMLITRDIIVERLLVDVEGKLEEKMNVGKLRRDQILMYALLGDPATRLHLPDKLDGKIERVADGWQWEVDKPKDTTKLYVSFRPAGQDFPMVEQPLQRSAARKRFEQANATFAFKPLGELVADEAWKGTIDEEGILRLVAIGPGQIYAVGFKLELPETPTDN